MSLDLSKSHGPRKEIWEKKPWLFVLFCKHRFQFSVKKSRTFLFTSVLDESQYDAFVGADVVDEIVETSFDNRGRSNANVGEELKKMNILIKIS